MSLSIKNLTKTYPNGTKAIDDLSTEIGKGMFGLLGPNGAGKSSLMRTIATLQSPDSGEVLFEGVSVLDNPMELRKKLGYLPQSFGVYPKVSAEKLLDYFAILKGITSKKERVLMTQHVLELTNLYNVRKKHVSGYSGGMKQRFGIAQLLLNKPKLIIVDEPTAGLDPEERNRFLNVLKDVGSNNTVIFSTHIVADVRGLCTDMAIMDKGRILKKATPQEAITMLNDTIWTRDITKEAFEDYASQNEIVSSSLNNDDTIRIRVSSATRPNGFEPSKPNLEDVYFLTLQPNTSNQATHV